MAPTAPHCRLAALALALVAGCAADRDPGYINALASNLAARGHLRVDTAPADAPFSTDDLVANFREIAFRYEFQFRDGALVEEPLETPLKRWQGPVRYRIEGDAVTGDDRAGVAALMARLAGLTGLGFTPVTGAHDLLITIAGPSGRDAVEAMLAAEGRDLYRRRYALWRRTPTWICGATLTADPAEPARIVHAHVFLGAELTGRMRQACLEEEIVQSLGLTNDSARARPSIFNDDQEFVRLTLHDAILLRTLYDPRLPLGATADQAMPEAARILAAHHAAMTAAGQ